MPQERGIPSGGPDPEAHPNTYGEELHHEDALPGKRQRIAAIQARDAAGRESRREHITKSVKQVMEKLIRQDTPFIGHMCSPEMLKFMIEELDEKATKKVMRDVRRTERRNFGKSKTDVAEVYSPPRMTTMAERLGYRAAFAFDLTTCDGDGVPWDLSIDRR